ncbi:hypothetical protein I532_04090 [Brevibacillus borstelensis AK1]|uniref:Uncharacterized protein n=1 Tax=Brevibacillus borstelensis AK1 TaxID=1300222 RepID=M8E672_9BACL|nr:hypothetical protein [Brevibacillus borstelensis]EMT54756.1 hypothetical protein I532_04090 [Brevibacillus borstelensis AK1]
MAKTHTIDGVQYNEVKRPAKVGEKIKVVEPFISNGKYGQGDVLEVAYRNEGSGIRLSHVKVTGINVPILDSEYVVLEPVEPTDTIVHDGKRYRKVDRPVREGDAFIIPKMRQYPQDLTEGKVYRLNRDFDGDPFFYDDVDDERYLPIAENDVYVLEPVETATPSLSALESELAATKAKVAEMEAQLAAVKQAEAEAQRLKVGDYVKVVDDRKRNGSKRTDVVIGEIRKITENDESSVPFRTTTLDGSDSAWFRAEALTRATDEEVAEAKRKLAFDQLKKGDKVRLMNGGGKFPLHGFQDGNIYEVVTPEYAHSRGTKVQIVDGGGYKGYADPDQLVKVTEEEAKWHAIGREVGQFKEGDIVRIVSKNVVGKVEDVGTSLLGISDYSGKYYGPDKECVELIAPVESVVNLRAGDAA